MNKLSSITEFNYSTEKSKSQAPKPKPESEKEDVLETFQGILIKTIEEEKTK